MARKGLGKGLGMGYKNLVIRDPMVHSLSARGIRQLDASSREWCRIHNLDAKNLPPKSLIHPHLNCLVAGDVFESTKWKLTHSHIGQDPYKVLEITLDEMRKKGHGDKYDRKKVLEMAKLYMEQFIDKYGEPPKTLYAKKRAKMFSMNAKKSNVKFSDIKDFMQGIESRGLIVDRDMSGQAFADKYGLTLWEGKQAVDYWYNYKNTGDYTDFTWREKKKRKGDLDAKGTFSSIKFFNKYDGEREIKTGDILNTNWGYDQTNVEFYKIIEITGKNRFKIQRLKDSTTETGFMSGFKVPLKEVKNEILNGYVDKHGYLRISKDDIRSLLIWDGEPEAVSWYA